MLPNLAHADAAELTTWLGSSQLAPRSTFVVHGEPSSADALRRTLRDELGWAASVPAHGGTSSCDGHPMTSEWERLEQVALALDPPARFDADTLTSRPATVRRYLTAAITAGTPARARRPDLDAGEHQARPVAPVRRNQLLVLRLGTVWGARVAGVVRLPVNITDGPLGGRVPAGPLRRSLRHPGTDTTERGNFVER